MKKNLVEVMCLQERTGIFGIKFGAICYEDLNSICMIEGEEFADFYKKEDEEYIYLGFFKTKRFV